MSAKNFGISVVIPNNNDDQELISIMKAVCSQTVKPAQIIIVDSLDELRTCPAEIVVMCVERRIDLSFKYYKGALPGGARNIGLELVNSELIAFIDVKTIPRPHWLEASVNALSAGNVAGVWGSTFFSSQSKFERLVRDGFYGVKPRRTLPGSVFRFEVFIKNGRFIDWVRAGEDTEWMLRLALHKIPIISLSSATVDYVGLIGLDMEQLLRKWYRNYSASRDLPHFFPQKQLLWLVVYPLLVLIAFNWNYLIADWQLNSPFYIGHVTKLVTIIPILIYVIVRGVVIPLKRGVQIRQLLPVRFLAILSICFVADLVKVLMLALWKRRHDAIMPNTDVVPAVKEISSQD
jgi:hypothetical protein